MEYRTARNLDSGDLGAVLGFEEEASSPEAHRRPWVFIRGRLTELTFRLDERRDAGAADAVLRVVVTLEVGPTKQLVTLAVDPGTEVVFMSSGGR